MLIISNYKLLTMKGKGFCLVLLLWAAGAGVWYFIICGVWLRVRMYWMFEVVLVDLGLVAEGSLFVPGPPP